VVAFHLDVIFNTRKTCDLLAAADEPLGVTQAELSWIDLLRLFLDIVQQPLQQAPRVGHLARPQPSAHAGLVFVPLIAPQDQTSGNRDATGDMYTPPTRAQAQC
jgi:hypothetical protein